MSDLRLPLFDYTPSVPVHRDHIDVIADTLGELRAAHRVVTELLERIERRVAHVETSQERQFRMAEEVVRRWENERRDFPTWVVTKCVRCVMRHGGLCPCCHEARIVDEHGRMVGGPEMDHWARRSDNSPDNGWLVCKSCNRRLGRAGGAEREDYRMAFVLFHRRLAEVANDGPRDDEDDCTFPLPFPPAA